MQALTDLSVAGRVALSALARRLRGDMTPPPDSEAFRRELDAALRALPPGLLAEYAWIELPATEPPWRDSGIVLRRGEQASYLAVGRVWASRALDIWIEPKNQIWTRIGEQGEIRSSSRNSGTLRADRDGAVLFGNYFPNDWVDRQGARLQDDAVYQGVSGGTRILLLRWAASAQEGLEALRRLCDFDGLVSGELERLRAGPSAPPGWSYLWHLGEAEIFRPCASPEGRPAICCDVEGDVGILQKDVSLPLTPQTEICWRWKVDSLPSRLREDSLPSHDYLSIAVEFDNGRDITWFWSRSLRPDYGFVCPLPNWKHKEFHVVVRTGTDGLGVWQTERRDVYADYQRYLGTPPARIVRVWFIANSIFGRHAGRCAFSEIRLRGKDGEVVVL